MRGWNRIEEFLLAPVLAVMAGLTFVGVAARYAGVPIAYVEEVVPNLFVWATFLGAALAAKDQAHPNLSALTERFPPDLRRWAERVVAGLTVLFFGVVGWQGVEAVRLSVRTAETTALGAPAYWVTLAVPVGAALYILRALASSRAGDGRGGGASAPEETRPAGSVSKPSGPQAPPR